MIVGLHADVKGEELKSMLEGRFRFHTDKVAAYEAQLEKMKEVDKALSAEAESISKTSTASPMESIQRAIQKHRDQTVYYKFMAEHIVTTEVYRLDREELISLGIATERYY